MSWIQREEGDYFHVNLSCPNRRKQFGISGVEPRIQNPRKRVDWGEIEGDNEHIKMRSIAKSEKK